jgi:hypothetical protein
MVLEARKHRASLLEEQSPLCRLEKDHAPDFATRDGIPALPFHDGPRERVRPRGSPEHHQLSGLLTDGAGTPVADGPYNLTLKLYGVSSGGAALWSETQSAVSVVRGIFSINLGSVSALALPFDQPYWLGVSIGADAELAPRTPLTSSPYALNVRTPLPANSVNAQVILDEPGIAQRILFGSHAVIGNANISPLNLFEDLNVTITTPARAT